MTKQERNAIENKLDNNIKILIMNTARMLLVKCGGLKPEEAASIIKTQKMAQNLIDSS